MEAEKLQMVNDAFNMYNNLLDKIKELYAKSEEYMILKRPELEDVLYDAEGYMHQVFNCIANATGEVTEEEQAFIDKLEVYKNKRMEAGIDSIIGSTFSNIPLYIELAKEVDKLAESNYAKDLINDTLAICKELMDIDGNTYYEESSFVYSFIDMLEKYIKEN